MNEREAIKVMVKPDAQKKRVSGNRTRWKKSLIRLNNRVKNRAFALAYLSSRNRLRILPVSPNCVGSSNGAVTSHETYATL